MVNARIMALCALLSVSWVGTSAPSVADTSFPYKLIQGDILSFSVLSVPELTRHVQVDVDGRVFLPLIGAVDAKGKTIEDLRQAVEERLRREPIRLPGSANRSDGLRTLAPREIIIDIAEYRPVYVTGAVAQPGEIPFRPGMTVRQAIARAGGIGHSAENPDEFRMLELRSRRDDVASQIDARRSRIERLQAGLQQLVAETNANGSGTRTELDAAPANPSPDMDNVAAAWLTARESRRDTERNLVEATLEEMLDRLEVLEELQRVGEEFVEVTERELARVTDLRERGIGREDAVGDAREDALLAASRSLDTANELLRLKELIAQTRGNLTVAELQERIDLIEAIETEVFDLVRLEKLLGTLDRNLRLFGELAAEEPTTRVVIRSFPSGAGDAPAEVSPGDPMKPGDVIDVLLLETSSEAPTDGSL